VLSPHITSEGEKTQTALAAPTAPQAAQLCPFSVRSSDANVRHSRHHHVHPTVCTQQTVQLECSTCLVDEVICTRCRAIP
jgi:hypothetical protein